MKENGRSGHDVRDSHVLLSSHHKGDYIYLKAHGRPFFIFFSILKTIFILCSLIVIVSVLYLWQNIGQNMINLTEHNKVAYHMKKNIMN